MIRVSKYDSDEVTIVLRILTNDNGVAILKENIHLQGTSHSPHVIFKVGDTNRWVRLCDVEKYCNDPFKGGYENMIKAAGGISTTKPNIRWRVIDKDTHRIPNEFRPPIIVPTMDKYYVTGVKIMGDRPTIAFLGDHNCVYEYDFPEDFPDTLVSKLAVVMNQTLDPGSTLGVGFPYTCCTIPGFEDIGWPLSDNKRGFVLIVTAKEAEEWNAREHLLK